MGYAVVKEPEVEDLIFPGERGFVLGLDAVGGADVESLVLEKGLLVVFKDERPSQVFVGLLAVASFDQAAVGRVGPRVGQPVPTTDWTCPPQNPIRVFYNNK